MLDRSVERVWQSRVTLAPRTITGEEQCKATVPMTDKELGPYFLIRQDMKLNDLPRHDESKEEPLRCSKRLCQKEKNINYHNDFDLGTDDHDLRYARNSTL